MYNKMRKIKRTIEIEYWEEICPYCKKLIKGRSESHAKYNFKLHKEACKEKQKNENNK